MICYHCGTEIHLERRPSRQEVCPNCSAYLHCCRNCTFYDPGAHNQCREPQADWIQDKEAANFCDYFEAAVAVKPSGSATRQMDARKKLENLFKKK